MEQEQLATATFPSTLEYQILHELLGCIQLNDMCHCFEAQSCILHISPSIMLSMTHWNFHKKLTQKSVHQDIGLIKLYYHPILILSSMTVERPDKVNRLKLLELVCGKALMSMHVWLDLQFYVLLLSIGKQSCHQARTTKLNFRCHGIGQ